MWKEMDTAPRDGTTITMKGHIDTHTKAKGTYRGSFNKEYNTFVTTGGWIIFPDKWKP